MQLPTCRLLLLITSRNYHSKPHPSYTGITGTACSTAHSHSKGFHLTPLLGTSISLTIPPHLLLLQVQEQRP
jgi:hypothetical protein